MGDATRISWTDSTFNPWMGCTKVSPACDHCYAERDMDTRLGRVKWGAGQARVRTGVDNWRKPSRWNDEPFWQCDCGWRGGAKALIWKTEQDAHCPACGTEKIEEARRRVFCASLADWLDNEVPIEWLVDLLDLIRRTPNLDWLLLTKRIGNWATRMKQARQWMSAQAKGWEATWGFVADWESGNPPPNVWIGSTVVTQEEVDRDLLKLLRVPAAIRFLSIEPMLSAMNIGLIGTLPGDQFSGYQLVRDRLHWVIAGGESGPKARPVHPDWIRALRDECKQADVPLHFKQWGAWLPIDIEASENECYADDGTDRQFDGRVRIDRSTGTTMGRVCDTGRTLDGRTWDEFPETAA